MKQSKSWIHEKCGTNTPPETAPEYSSVHGYVTSAPTQTVEQYQAESFLYKLKGAVMYCGGDVDTLIDEKFQNTIECLFRNGIELSVDIKQQDYYGKFL